MEGEVEEVGVPVLATLYTRGVALRPSAISKPILLTHHFNVMWEIWDRSLITGRGRLQNERGRGK